MDPQAKMNASLQRHVQQALVDWQGFCISEMIHSWIEAAPEGSLDKLIEAWRTAMEQKFEALRAARFRQTGLIETTADAEKSVLDHAVAAIYSLFADEEITPPNDPADTPDDQPPLIVQ